MYSICFLAAVGILDGQGDAWGTFWVCLIAGVLPLLLAIQVGRRRTVLVIGGDTLRITTAGLFGAKERLWQCEELVDIRTGPGNYDINDVPIAELQVHLITGASFGFLVERDAEELESLAVELRRTLHLPAKGERL